MLLKSPLSCILIIIIWVVCLIPVPETPLDHVAFIDKWTHFAMYGSLTMCLILEYSRRHRKIHLKRYITGAFVLPCIMGGLVELAQAYLTNGIRSGDWLDFLANATGALLGFCLGTGLWKIAGRKRP